MRNRFVDYFVEKIKQGQGDNIVVMTGDLGFSVLEPFQDLLGPRFLNVGIAEALMASMSAGIAKEGYKVFIYSITPFATFRCLEQIRNDICYHNADVTVVGVGAGFGYGSLGPTHHALEDLAAMWSLPGMQVYSPADLNESNLCFEKCFNHKGPQYLRLGKGREGNLSEIKFPDLVTMPVLEYGSGTDVCLISTGNILEEVLSAKKLLTEQGLSVQVLSCPWIKPFPAKELLGLLKSKNIVVVEELNPFGGFSSEAVKSLACLGDGLRFRTISVKDRFAKSVGSLKFQRSDAGVSSENIINVVNNLVK